MQSAINHSIQQVSITITSVPNAGLSPIAAGSAVTVTYDVDAVVPMICWGTSYSLDIGLNTQSFPVPSDACWFFSPRRNVWVRALTSTIDREKSTVSYVASAMHVIDSVMMAFGGYSTYSATLASTVMTTGLMFYPTRGVSFHM